VPEIALRPGLWRGGAVGGRSPHPVPGNGRKILPSPFGSTNRSAGTLSNATNIARPFKVSNRKKIFVFLLDSTLCHAILGQVSRELQMRQLVQGSVKRTDVVANAKFLVIRGRKAEAVYFPANMTPEEVKKSLVDRQEVTDPDRVIRP